eukprot:g5336.t1
MGEEGVPIYYLAGKDKKGKFEPCIDVVSNDPTRRAFVEKFKSNESFRKNTLRWTKYPVEKYLKDYAEKANCPGPNIKSKEVTMCSNLYLLGRELKRDGEKVTIKTEDGKTSVFKKEETCPWDKLHDGPVEELPCDVCALPAFGEAALLKTMRRRLTESLNIYTYVGDIVLCLNPYMYLPEMVDIAEYPNQKNYRVGEDPNSYATAHFAYWGALDSHADVQNQSCIVSGESGAGKTVACGFIMKYLAKLSDWRKLEQNLPIGSSGVGKKDVTSLVAGVSPFLEAFGNAKTNMNDNSSRFGKFTKIWFSDGKIVGAELEHYLLEKARLCGQGSGERSYHIFYNLIRGGTDEEKAALKLTKCEDYPLLCEGGSTLIGHGHDESYDAERMNNPLHDDPDDTGVRAALTAANVEEDVQQQLWKAVAGSLHLLSIDFVENGNAEKSKVAPNSSEKAKFCAGLLGMNIDNFEKFLCIYRLNLPGGTFADKDCSPDAAKDNRNALAKEIYDRIFTWLINVVCNNVLMPSDDKTAFVGLLDIFGFEVMPKNSIEQLCINFANEKLQQLFSHVVFDNEAKTFKSEGLDDSVIPPHKDNTACCNLVAGKGKKFMGLFNILDDMAGKKDVKDKQVVAKWNKRFGKKKGLFKKAKDSLTREASEYYYGDTKKDYLFTIIHYAGAVHYDARQFCLKNGDKLPPQLLQLAQETTVDFVKTIFGGEEQTSSKKKKKGGHGKKTLASKYLKQLGNLSATLNATTPHYVRCVKPNDIHYRPVDGNGAFNAQKTYRQLLYAGVMDVVKIKKAGFPFRMTYEKFWNYIVKNNMHTIAGIPATGDARDSCEQIAKLVLPASKIVKNEATQKEKEIFFWAMGKTMFFGKDTTRDDLREWQQEKVSVRILGWSRYWIWLIPIQNFHRSVTTLQDHWRVVLAKRKYALVEKSLVIVQGMARSATAFNRYLWLKQRSIAIVRIQKAVRNYSTYLRFLDAYKLLVEKGAKTDKELIAEYYVDLAKQKLAKSMIGSMLVAKLKDYRRLVLCQTKCRVYCDKKHFFRLLRRLALENVSGYKVAALYQLSACRRIVVHGSKGVRLVQARYRMMRLRREYLQFLRAVRLIQNWVQKTTRRYEFLNRQAHIIICQRVWRYWNLRNWYMRYISAARTIEKFFWGFLVKMRFDDWMTDMTKSCTQGLYIRVQELLALVPPYDCLGHVPTSMLVNMRDKNYFTSFVHAAATSGSIETVRVLVKNNAKVDVSDLVGNTPLHCSVSEGDSSLRVSQFLLENSTNKKKLLSRQNKEGQLPFDCALESEKEKEKTIVWLMEEGAEVSPQALESLNEEVKERDETLQFQEVQRRRLKRAMEREQQCDVGWQSLLLSLPGAPDQIDRYVVNRRARLKLKAVIAIQAVARRWLALGGFYVDASLQEKMKSMRFQTAPQRGLGQIISNATPSKSLELVPSSDPWTEAYTDSGAIFYHNSKTGESTWSVPEGYVADSRTGMLKRAFNNSVAIAGASPEFLEQLKEEESKQEQLENQLKKMEEQLSKLSPRKAKDIEEKFGSLADVKKTKTAAVETMSTSFEPIENFKDLKSSLLQALCAYEYTACVDPSKKGWYYIDGAGEVHGVYSGTTMSQWFSMRAFHPEQPVAVSGDDQATFMSICDIFPNASVDGTGATFDLEPLRSLRIAREAIQRYNL